MIVVGKSWVGRVRSRNEDVYWSRPDLNSCGVADGMGGLDSGHIAARMTADAVTDEIRERGSESLDAEALSEVIKAANRTVFQRARELPDVEVMGATLVMLQIVDNTSFVCHAGDARGYLLRNSKLCQLTRDHSLVNDLLDSGELTEAELETSTIRNQVTQGIGPSQVVQPTVSNLALQQQDLFMLCSDGLTGFVSNSALEEVMNEHRPNLNLLLDALIAMAGEYGSTDNITVVLAEIN